MPAIGDVLELARGAFGFPASSSEHKVTLRYSRPAPAVNDTRFTFTVKVVE